MFSIDILKDPSFWVAVAFVGFVAIIFYLKIPKKIGNLLDEKIKKIETEIHNAEKLKDDARELLSSYEKKYKNAHHVEKQMIEKMQKDFERFSEETKRNAEEKLDREKKLIIEKIDNAEKKALQEMRSKAINMAFDLSKKIISEKIEKNQVDKILNENIENLDKKTNL